MIAAADIFSRGQIAFTAGCTAVIVFALAIWRVAERRAWPVRIVIALLAGGAVYLWRASANMPQLNRDGISGYSANDWLAPVVTFVALTIYADVFRPANERRFGQLRAAATLTAFAVNVITI